VPDVSQQVAPDPSYAGSAEKRLVESRKQTAAVSVAGRDAERGIRSPYEGRPVPVMVDDSLLPEFPFLFTLLGTAVGGVVGHQSHHGLEGAGIGAAAGMLMDYGAHRARENRRRARPYP